MASDFNIGILSTLEIDSSSSRKKINDTLKNIEANINSIKADLEVSDTKKSENNAIKSANNVIRNINSNGNLKKLNVELDVNLTKSRQNIQRALSTLSKDFKNKKIDVEVNAKANKNSIGQVKNSISKGASQPLEIKESPSSRSTSRDIKEQQSLMTGLANSYKNLDDLTRALNTSTFEGLRKTVKEIKNADNSLKSYQVTLERVNQEGKKLGSQRFDYTPSANGLKLNKTQLTDQTDKARKEENAAINKLLENEVSKYDRLLNKGKIDIKQHQTLLQTLRQITNEKSKANQFNRTDFNRVAKAAADEAKEYQYQNDMLRKKLALTSQIERIENRMAATIDKQQTNALKNQLNSLGNNRTPFGKEAAFHMNQIQDKVRQISAEAERATRTQLSFVDQFREAMTKFPVWMGATTLFFGAINGAKEMLDVITEIDGKMITLAKVTGDDNALQQTFIDANNAASQFGQTLGSVLDVYAEFARQGVKGNELSQFSNAALIAANVGEIDAKQASEYLTSMSAQWETTGNQAMRQVDSLNEVSNKYATTVEKLAQGQAKAGSTAKSMGLTFDETNGIIGALTAKTKQSGDEIGNFMKATLPKLYSGKGKSTIEGLGISMKDENGQLKSAISLLEEVSQKTKNLEKDQKAAVINGLGGTYHYQRMQVLLDDLSKTDGLYKQIKESSESSAGSALQENAKYMESIEAKVNQAKTAFEQFALAVGETFAKSGMLDGIRMVTQLLTGLTHGITELGTTAPIFGMVGGAASLMSKNVRSGFEGARSSVANYITEVNKLAKVNNAAGQVVGLQKVQTGTASQLQFNKNGEYDKAASQAKAAEQATYQFSKAQKDVSASAMIASGAINKTTVATTASTVATRAATLAVNGLKLAFRGLLAATGVGLAITGVSFVLEKGVGSFNAASQAAEQYKQKQEQTKQAIASMSNGEINSLISSYDKLQQKMNSGSAFNTAEAEKYKEVTSQLANIFPDLVTGENRYGKEMAGNKEVMKQKIELIKQEMELERQKNAIKQKEEQDAYIKEQDSLAKKNRGQKWYQLGQTPELKLQEQARPTTVSDNSNINKINATIQKVKSQAQAEKALEQVDKQLAQSQTKNRQNEVQHLQKVRQALQDYITKTGQANQATRAAVLTAQQQFTNQIATMKKLGTTGQQVMTTISNSVAKTAKSGKAAQATFKSFETSLVKSSSFKSKMASYEASVKKFKNAANQSAKIAALKDVERDYSKVAKGIMQAAKAANMSKSQMKDLKKSLQQNIQAETGFRASVSKAGKVTIDQSKKIKQNTAETRRNSSAKLQNADASDQASEENKELADSMRAGIESSQLLGKAMGELQSQGTLSTETLIELTEKYGDEILAVAGDQEALSNFIMQKQNEETDNYNKNLKTKLENSSSYYKAVAGADSALSNYLMENYGIDTKNYKSLTEVKAKITDLYYNGSAEEQAKVVDAIAKAYHIDLSNYGSLNEKKEALENQLMKILGSKWKKYIGSVAKDMKSLGVDAGEVGADGFDDSKMFNPGALIGANNFQNVSNLSNISNVFNSLNGAFNEAKNEAAGVSRGLDDAASGLKDVGDSAGSAGSGLGKTAKGADKASDSLDGTNKELEKTKEKAEEAGVTVKQLYKQFTVTTYVADKLSMALDKINNKLEKQKLLTEKYATWSSSYRNSLKAENKLLDEKTAKIKKQIESMKEQIAQGKVIEYGLVGKDINVPYYEYTANNLDDGETGRISRYTGNSTQAKVWNFFKSKGLSDHAVAGIMGNMERESRFKPGAQEQGGTGIGLVQLSFGRANNLRNYAARRGKSWKDLNTQLDFIWKELNTTEVNALRGLKSATSVIGAANSFQRLYERAGVVAQGERNAAAKKYYRQFKGTNGSSGFLSGGVVAGTNGKPLTSDRNAYILDRQFRRYNGGGVHHGRDITSATINGSPIKAARSGIVTFKGWTGGGNTLSIFDGKNTYTYMHMKNPARVVKGQRVKAGQIVGNVGTTHDRRLGGFSTGPHLHVQVNLGKTPSGTFMNTFNGAHRAVDPVKYGYTRVSGGGSLNLGSLTSGHSAMSGSISAAMAEDLNEAEQERLNKIEQAINAHNKAEEMKQKVDELRKTLMDKQLEEVQTAKEKSENLYNIQKSHVEEYDHWRTLQEARSAKLEYELNKIEFEKGRNTKEWRNKNKQLQASRQLEVNFEDSKIQYINKALKKNANKIFGKNTVNRDEFETMKRDAQQNIRDLKAGIQTASGEIATSMIDQILDEYEDRVGKVSAKIEKMGKQKEKLDLADNKQALKSSSLSRQQAKDSKSLASYINFYIKQLERQLKLTGKNHELQQKVKEQIKEMKVAYDDATLAAHQYITEAAEVDTERQLQLNANRLRDAQNELSKADYKAGFISQEYQIDLYRKNQEAKFKGYLKEKEALEQNKSELQDMYEIYKSVPTQAQKIKEALIETKNAIRDNNKGLYDLKYDMANSVINQIKDIYSKQLEVATKAYDDEYKAYEKMINKKLKLIDDEQTQESFNKDVRDRTEAMDKIRDEIAQRSGDDSLANQKKLKDLREQLKQQEEDYTMFINNKNRDDRRKALQDELNDKNEQIQEQKEDLNKAFQDLIGDTRRFNAIQESLMEGQIDKYKSLIADLTKYVNDNMKEIGRSTSEGILDGLAASFKGLSSLSKELQKQEKNNLNPVPNSKLKPTKVDEATIAAIKKVNGLSPTTILQGLDIKPVNLPKDVKPSKTVTNNNKTTAKALVNIENFNGTKAEADKLANNLATAMRKQGVL